MHRTLHSAETEAKRRSIAIKHPRQAATTVVSPVHQSVPAMRCLDVAEAQRSIDRDTIGQSASLRRVPLAKAPPPRAALREKPRQVTAS